MKKHFALLALCLGASVAGATPFYQYFYNPDGSAQTNPFTMQVYPPVNAWTVVGTNMYYGAQVTTFTPNSLGYVSNQIAPNTYSVLFSNLNSGFYVTIPNTTNVATLASYATSAPTISGTAFDSYGLVTNWLHFPPATNGAPLAYSLLPFTPPTNTPSGLDYVYGFHPATNNPGTNVIIYISGITTFTNGSGGVTNFTLTFATNTLNYQHQ